MQQISVLIRTGQKYVSANGKEAEAVGGKGKYNIANRTKHVTFDRKISKFF